MSDPNEIVGHKTLSDGKGGHRHEPLTRAEADAIMAQVEASKARRAELYPDAEACAKALWDAWYRLKELGWKEPMYAPADARLKKTVSAGSSGIHDAYCDHIDPDCRRHWWHPSEGDLWPHKPLLYYPDEQEQREDEERGAKIREAGRRFRESLSSEVKEPK